MVEGDQLGGGPVDIHCLAAQGPWDSLVCATTQRFPRRQRRGRHVHRPSLYHLPRATFFDC